MESRVEIKFRKERFGPELDMVNNFLEHNKNLFFEQELEFTSLTEPYAEAGIPDILLIFWDKNLCKNWHPKRNELTRTDIKILHHISNYNRKGIKIDKLYRDLNFDEKTFKKSFYRLSEANLIVIDSIRVSINDLDKIFFIRKIISIEAKISNWKSAFHQAQLNENFSSHSYVLLPAEKMSNDILSYCTGNTGLLIQDGLKSILKKKAKKNQIPGSYFSWILNEYLGRQCDTIFSLK